MFIFTVWGFSCFGLSEDIINYLCYLMIFILQVISFSFMIQIYCYFSMICIHYLGNYFHMILNLVLRQHNGLIVYLIVIVKYQMWFICNLCYYLEFIWSYNLVFCLFNLIFDSLKLDFYFTFLGFDWRH